jgi:prepilin-type N-terminal cleavage/methylation domain-containing protein
MKTKPGFTLTEFLITGAIIALLAVAGTMLLGIERARLRDAKRIADMTHFAAGFAVLYAAKASYVEAAAGCGKKGVLASTCALPTLTGLEDELIDPGNYSYRLSRVPDAEDFGIMFHLERTYGTLAAGNHVLTKEGIK